MIPRLGIWLKITSRQDPESCGYDIEVSHVSDSRNGSIREIKTESLVIYPHILTARILNMLSYKKYI